MFLKAYLMGRTWEKAQRRRVDSGGLQGPGQLVFNAPNYFPHKGNLYGNGKVSTQLIQKKRPIHTN
eukprot:c54414_g1_i1 orf=174-371(+)